VGLFCWCSKGDEVEVEGCWEEGVKEAFANPRRGGSSSWGFFPSDSPSLKPIALILRIDCQYRFP